MDNGTILKAVEKVYDKLPRKWTWFFSLLNTDDMSKSEMTVIVQYKLIKIWIRYSNFVDD